MIIPLGLGYFARNRFNTQLRKFCRRSIVNSNPVAASQGLQIPVAALTRGLVRSTQPTVTKRQPGSPLVIVPAKAWTFGHGSPLENTRRPRARCAIWTLKARPQASVNSPFLLGRCVPRTYHRSSCSASVGSSADHAAIKSISTAGTPRTPVAGVSLVK